MIVIDSSVLIAALVEETDDAAWSRTIAADPELHAPELVLAEAMNGVRRSELNHGVSTVQAEFARNTLGRMGFSLYTFNPFAERIWDLRHNLTCYDAWYVALAETLGCPLVTLDRRMSRAGGVQCQVLTPPD